MTTVRIILCSWLFFVTFSLSFGKENYCYYIRFFNTDWTDRPPRVVVNMTFTAQGSIDSTTTINEEIPSPITHIRISQQNYKEKPKTIYNITAKLCDLKTLFKQVPLIKPASESLFKQSNFTFSCPLFKGTYVMSKMRVSSKNPMLVILYNPKRSFLIEGGIFEELPDKSLNRLTTYNMTVKIIKKACEKSAGND